MDADRARQLAVARFTETGLGDLDSWEIRGPREGDVRTPAGTKAHLIYDFVPRTAEGQAGRRLTLSVAVDPDNGAADMLR